MLTHAKGKTGHEQAEEASHVWTRLHRPRLKRRLPHPPQTATRVDGQPDDSQTGYIRSRHHVAPWKGGSHVVTSQYGTL